MKEESKHPLPPFTMETARQKVQMAEDAWNSQNPEMVAKAYSLDSEWRNRTQFINGREEIIEFLKKKWQKERNYKLKKELWGFRENRIAVSFKYEYQDENNPWYRAYGNELWEFKANGLMRKRYASINDLEINAEEREIL